jgi:Arc/MetJ-type ribon-helix-helix transcriptional regulator
MAEKKQGEKTSKLVNVTINLPQVYLWNIDKLREHGLFNSRSEVIRAAIKEFLDREFGIIDLLDAKTCLGKTTPNTPEE